MFIFYNVGVRSLFYCFVLQNLPLVHFEEHLQLKVAKMCL
jgi:hypothetical protein